MKKLVLFGTGDIAQLALHYFTIDSDYEVVAFTVDQKYVENDEFEGLPVVAFEEVQELFPPGEHRVFVALSYSQMNKLRQQKFEEAKAKGYSLASYVSSRCSYLSTRPPGDNAFILEDNTVQPFVVIGDNVTLWSGNHIGHHSTIKSHNFVSSHVVISGHCVVEPHCFLGVNSSVGHKVTIAPETLLGAGAVVTKDTEAGGVYVAPRSVKLKMKSDSIQL